MLFITVRCLAMTSTKHVSLGAEDAVLSGQPAEDVVGRTARRARAVVTCCVAFCHICN